MFVLLAWLVVLVVLVVANTSGFWWKLLYWVELKLMRIYER